MSKCLIVVDMQNDFIDGALGFEAAKEVIEPIKQKIRLYRQQHHDILFTKDTHRNDYLNTIEGENLPVKHCIEGTKGHAIHDEIEALKKDDDPVFKKETFASHDLARHMKKQSYTEVELCGLVSNICVISNAIIVKSVLPSTKIFIDAKATRSFDADMHEKALDVLEGLHIEIKNRS